MIRLAVEPKPAERLLPTPILQQTSLWGRVKSRLGWESAAFDILAGRDGAEGEAADLLLVTRPVAAGRHVAYAPLGPEYLPDEESRGPYLERLSYGRRGEGRFAYPAETADEFWKAPGRAPGAR